MTTWESIDNVDIKNVIVTSDEAFERVTSDEGFVDEWEKWFLKQNTAWLVQDIPNISFLDIADTFLESKKTLWDKKWYILIVWNAWKSVEVLRQDSINIWLWEDKSISTTPALVQLDTWDITDDSDKIEVDQQHVWRINILMSWYYRISYGWTIDALSATQLTVEIYNKNDKVTWEIYSWISGKLSWWRTLSLSLNEWDYIYMRVDANDSIDNYLQIIKDACFLHINVFQLSTCWIYLLHILLLVRYLVTIDIVI